MKKQLITLVAGSLLLASAAYAGDNNHAEFGVVNMQDVIQNSTKIKSMQAGLKAQVQPMQDKLKKEYQQVQALSKDPKLSKQLATAKAQFKKDLATYQDLQHKQHKQQDQIKNLLMTSIDEVRVDLKLKAIYVKAVVLSSDPKEFMDVTPMVEKHLNKS